MSNPPVDAGVERAILNASLNGQLLGNLLFGTHTAIFFYTLSIYLRKKHSRNLFVIGCISLSYITYLADTIIEWDILKTSLIDNGQTRESAFVDAFVVIGPKGFFASEVTKIVLTDLADALMIWRCYFVWNRSIRAIILPCFFLFCKTASDLAVLCILATSDLMQTDPAHRLVGSALFMTFFTNLVTTVLIGYRINSVRRHSTSHNSRALFQHVLEMLVQSSAAYCIVSFAFAVSVTLATAVHDSLDHHTAVLFGAQEFIDVLFTFTSCSVPTLMVARTAFLPHVGTPSSATPKMSGLEFHAGLATSGSTTRMSSQGIDLRQNGDNQLEEPKLSEVKTDVIHLT